MKTFIIWFILFTGLVGTIFFLLSQRTNLSLPGSEKKQTTDTVRSGDRSYDEAVVYTCTGNIKIATAFETGNSDILELSLPDSGPMLLSRADSTTGSKFESSTGIIFWEKDGTAFVEKNDEGLYEDCKVITNISEAETEVVATPVINELNNSQWLWIETTDEAGTSLKPNQPDDFVLTFAEANRFSANTDCNNIGGSFVVGEGGALVFSEIVATEMACEGETREQAFVEQLGAVVSYSVTDSELILTVLFDGETGEMKFSRK